MKHFLSYSIYEDYHPFASDSKGLLELLKSQGCDGLELLTGYTEINTDMQTCSPAVHLPYAIDWYAAWNNEDTSDPEDSDMSRYIYYGKNREEVVENVSVAIKHAAMINPAYGVLHAGSSKIDDVFLRQQSRSDQEVLHSFTEFVNTVASNFGGNIPFRILFENLWSPGLKLISTDGFKYLDSHIEFDNWGLCLDTGHMLCSLGNITSEEMGISSLKKIFEKYPKDLIEKITTVHFHTNCSGNYIPYFDEHTRNPNDSVVDIIAIANEHVSKMDQHQPFTNKAAKELIDILQPDFITHEMLGSDLSQRLSAFSSQRSLF